MSLWPEDTTHAHTLHTDNGMNTITQATVAIELSVAKVCRDRHTYYLHRNVLAFVARCLQQEAPFLELSAAVLLELRPQLLLVQPVWPGHFVRLIGHVHVAARVRAVALKVDHQIVRANGFARRQRVQRLGPRQLGVGRRLRRLGQRRLQAGQTVVIRCGPSPSVRA